MIPRTREKRPRCFGFCQSRKAIAMNRPRKRSRPAASSRERPRGTAAYRNCDRDATCDLAREQAQDILQTRESEFDEACESERDKLPVREMRPQRSLRFIKRNREAMPQRAKAIVMNHRKRELQERPQQPSAKSQKKAISMIPACRMCDRPQCCAHCGCKSHMTTAMTLVSRDEGNQSKKVEL